MHMERHARALHQQNISGYQLNVSDLLVKTLEMACPGGG